MSPRNLIVLLLTVALGLAVVGMLRSQSLQRAAARSNHIAGPGLTMVHYYANW